MTLLNAVLLDEGLLLLVVVALVLAIVYLAKRI